MRSGRQPGSRFLLLDPSVRRGRGALRATLAEPGGARPACRAHVPAVATQWNRSQAPIAGAGAATACAALPAVDAALDAAPAARQDVLHSCLRAYISQGGHDPVSRAQYHAPVQVLQSR